ncbi:MAG: outer membrane beta-barrel protein [bacterium]|nr:porin [bacterium]MBU1919076.1 porin [bacterium]
MKKLLILAVIAALSISSVANAELELSGNVTTGAAYQWDSTNAANTQSVGNTGVANGGAGGITQGDMRFAPTADSMHFGFYVDQAEIDIDSEFGENIRARIDLDFIDLGSPSFSAFLLEQAYVTVNMPAGNGMEFLIGKFNAPMGLESVDRHENIFPTYTPGFVFLTPTQVMGTKLYYDFDDNWNFDFAVVDSMNSRLIGNSPYPSGIMRVGAVWGDEGRESYMHIAGGFGPELNRAVNGSSEDKHFDMLGMLWGNFAFGDYWDLGYEGIYRSTNTLAGATNMRAVAGQMYTKYQASDVWSVQLRGAAFWEMSSFVAGTSGASTTGGTFGGFKGMTYSGSLATTYQITDGAEMTLEYRFDFANVSGLANANFHTGVAEFAYSF